MFAVDTHDDHPVLAHPFGTGVGRWGGGARIGFVSWRREGFFTVSRDLEPDTLSFRLTYSRREPDPGVVTFSRLPHRVRVLARLDAR